MRTEVETADYWIGLVQQDGAFMVSVVVKKESCKDKQFIMNQAECFLGFLKKISKAQTA